MILSFKCRNGECEHTEHADGDENTKTTIPDASIDLGHETETGCLRKKSFQEIWIQKQSPNHSRWSQYDRAEGHDASIFVYQHLNNESIIISN